jgi:beta-glucosidase
VVQLYVSDTAASVPVPIRQLQGFERIHLAPGEVERVTFALTPGQLSLIDGEGRRVIEPGEFQVAVGGRQPTSDDFAGKVTDVLTATIEVTGAVTEIWRRQPRTRGGLAVSDSLGAGSRSPTRPL